VPDLVTAFAIGAAVLIGAALISGVVERSPLSFPLIYLALGFALSPRISEVLEIAPDDAILEAVATLTLALVLFLDGVRLQVEELGRRWVVPALVLGPGTGIIIALGAIPLALLVDFRWVIAFMGGAILASTDPVVLRDVVRDTRIPRSVRQVLKLEAGMNDLVVLPVVLILIAVAQEQFSGAGDWARFLFELLLIGPVLGFAIGGVGAYAIGRVDRYTSIRTEYQALYGVGLVLAAYSSAATLEGDGFLAAFFAGLAVVVLNQTLCDCFLEYGEVTAEMAMLLAFVLFGAVLAEVLDEVQWGPALALAALVVFVIRPLVLNLVLLPATLSWRARVFVAWFGPRGLNSLLLALLVVHAALPEATELLATVGVVVIASVVLHGASAPFLSAWYGRHAASETLSEERESTVAGLFLHGEETQRIGPEQLAELLEGPEAPIVLDVRSRSSYDHDRAHIAGDVRVLPDEVRDWAVANPTDRLVVAYCT
jgi:NhaP-type Na+/H+ or K+/H+ antiporter